MCDVLCFSSILCIFYLLWCLIYIILSVVYVVFIFFFFFQAEDGIRDTSVTGVQTCALPIWPLFQDPMAGKGQPPALPTAGLTNYVGVANGCLSCMVQPLQPGQYYAVDSKGHPTGGILSGSGTVTFSDGGTGFGNYGFYGGLSFPSTTPTATFYPG